VYFYIVLRKLIAKLQVCSKRIQETAMVRFYSSVYSYDKMLIREMSRGSVFHGFPHPIAAVHRPKTECLGSVPDELDRSLIRVRNSLFLSRRYDIRGGALQERHCTNEHCCGKIALH
jgi:hypothetical protein